MASSRAPSRRHPNRMPATARANHITVPDDWPDSGQMQTGSVTPQPSRRLINICRVSGCYKARSFSPDGKERQWCSYHHEATTLLGRMTVANDWPNSRQQQTGATTPQPSRHLVDFCRTSGCHKVRSFSWDGRERQWCSYHHEAM